MRCLRVLKAQKVGRVAGKRAPSPCWCGGCYGWMSRTQTLSGCVAVTVIVLPPMSPFLGFRVASVSPDSPISCDLHHVSERKGPPFDWPLLKDQVVSRKFFLNCPGYMGRLGRSRIPEPSASRGPWR